MKQRKRLMLLGGLSYLIPVIESAHRQGYYVITADYIPSNIAHKYSDEYCNVSVIDKDAVLAAAIKLNIDGIMSFAVDPGVISASYVQDKLGLPAFGPYESVEILQNKDKFRDFLERNNFNVPISKSFSSEDEALSCLEWYEYPMIVKPTDAAGSKGVTKIENEIQLRGALKVAFDSSKSHRIIVEKFIDKLGCSSDTECFSLNGNLVFSSFNAQHFDDSAANPYTPASYSWPSTYSLEQEEYLHSELQRLLSLLKMNTSIYNVESRIGIDGKAYIMEVSPRGGGNRLAEMIKFSIGVDLITACVRASVGDSVGFSFSKEQNGFWCEIILHSHSEGIFQRIEIDDVYKSNVIELDLWVRSGDRIEKFTGANKALGTLIMRFNHKETMNIALSTQSNWLKIITA